jgi:hypothetical protein
MAREFVTAILKALRARDPQTVSIAPFGPFSATVRPLVSVTLIYRMVCGELRIRETGTFI